MGDNPESLPGCLGCYKAGLAKCKSCEYQSLCLKVIPRDEVKSLLQEILNEIANIRESLKK